MVRILKKIGIYNFILSVSLFVYGLAGILRYKNSIIHFFSDPFRIKKISSISTGINKYIDITLINLNLFLSLAVFVLFILFSVIILRKISQVYVRQYKLIFKLTLVYLIFIVISDLYYLPITMDDLIHAVQAEGFASKIFYFLKYFNYVIVLPFFLFLSRYLLKSKIQAT